MKAKRGDLAVIVTERRDWIIDQPGSGHTEERTEVEVFEVTSITREGLVKAVRDVWDGSRPQLMAHRARHAALYVVPAAEIDVAAAMASARAHTYPNSDTPMAYSSVAEVKEMLRAHRLTAGVQS